MKKIAFIFFLLFATIVQAQMQVYTVAGSSSIVPGDGGPATAAGLGATEGIWIDGNCNLYISDLDNRIRRVSLTTGIITTIVGNDIAGYTGDGGLATNAEVHGPYGLYADKMGNVYFSDLGNLRIRRIDALTGIITTFAGGGSSLGDGGPATNAQLTRPSNVYGDNKGNFYIGDFGRIRKVDKSGTITTFIGNGIAGLSGDGGPATAAQIGIACTMLFDAFGDFYFADRNNNRIRKVTTKTGIITTVAGTTDGYSGDGGPATSAQLSGPISFVFDVYNNMVIGDNQNNVIRKVDFSTHIITTIAGVGTSVSGNYADGAPATAANIHPEFMYLDLQGNIYFSNYDDRTVRKVTNYNPGLLSWSNTCGFTAVPQIKPAKDNEVKIFPNPAGSEINMEIYGAYRTGTTDVQLFDILGKERKVSAVLDGSGRMTLTDLPPGVYMLLFSSDGLKIGSRTFVKDR